MALSRSLMYRERAARSTSAESTSGVAAATFPVTRTSPLLPSATLPPPLVPTSPIPPARPGPAPGGAPRPPAARAPHRVGSGHAHPVGSGQRRGHVARAGAAPQHVGQRALASGGAEDLQQALAGHLLLELLLALRGVHRLL